jgi:hypothetical protein
MPKHKKENSFVLYSLHLPVLLLLAAVVGMGAVTYLSSSGAANKNILGTNSKTKESKGKSDEAKGKSNTPNKEEGSTNATEHKNNVSEVVTSLEEVAQTEDVSGNKETGKKIKEVAETIDEQASDTVDTIEEVESRSSWKTLLLGPDYKNLGQLRSSLAHNTNEIRQLTLLLATVSGESAAELQTQLDALKVESQRIYDLISTNESKFSLLGWVSRYILGYPSSPIGEAGDDLGTKETTESTQTVEDDDTLDSGSAE